MNVIQRLTLTSLKKNKKRTAVTIIGTVIAVAMVTAIAVISSSLVNMYAQQNIMYYGKWHMEFRGVDKNSLAVFNQNKNISHIDFYSDEGSLLIPDSEEKMRRDIRLLAYTPDSYSRIPISFLEGRMPDRPSEIILSNNFKSVADTGLKIGDTIIFETGEFIEGSGNKEWVKSGSKELKIVGFANFNILERGSDDSYKAITYLDISDAIHSEAELSVQLTFKKPSNKIYELGEEYAKELSLIYGDNFTGPYFNEFTLSSYGVARNISAFSGLFMFMFLLLLIIAIGGISLINNAFSISLSERIRSLGMLAGAGATKKQKRESVFFEAFLIGLVAIPSGVIGGVAGIGVVLRLLGKSIGKALNSTVEVALYVPFWAILFSVLFSFLVLVISAWIPAKKASKISSIEAIRATGSEKVSKSGSGKLIARLFGFEASIGIKNSKRNRKRYLSILSSLIVSVVIFISVSSALLYINRAMGLSMERSIYSLQCHINIGENEQNFNDLTEKANEIRRLPNAGQIDAAYISQKETMFLAKDRITTDAAEAFHSMYGESDEGYDTVVFIYALDEETYKRYCEKAGIESDKTQNGSAAILVSPLPIRTVNKGWAEHDATNIQAGESIVVKTSFWEGGATKSIEKEWVIAERTTVLPDIYNNQVVKLGSVMLVTRLADYESVLTDIQEQGGGNTRFLDLYSDTRESTMLYKELEALPKDGNFHLMYYDVGANIVNRQTLVMVISVFTYGFITLMSLVCLANIFNSVSTSVALRTKEFAVLRSCGLTNRAFRRMLDTECLYYGFKALIYGLPTGGFISFILYKVLAKSFEFDFALPWGSFIGAAIGVFIIVGLSALYSRNRVCDLNIAEAMKNENW